jgi:hypothetical protein
VDCSCHSNRSVSKRKSSGLGLQVHSGYTFFAAAR